MKDLMKVKLNLKMNTKNNIHFQEIEVMMEDQLIVMMNIDKNI
jgi:hypothetical protein